MASHFLYNLVFAGIVQGFFLSLFILSSKQNKSKASVYLGLLILSITITNLQYTLDELEIIGWNTFNLIFLPYLFLLAPLLYFFVISYLYPERRPKKIELLLYIPVIIVLTMALLYKVIALSTGRTLNNDPFQEKLADLIDVYGDFVNISIILITIILLFIAIKKYTKSSIETKTKVAKNELLWINFF